MKHIVCIDHEDTQEHQEMIIAKIKELFPDHHELNPYTFVVFTDQWSADRISEELAIPSKDGSNLRYLFCKKKPQICHIVMTLSAACRCNGWWAKSAWNFLSK